MEQHPHPGTPHRWVRIGKIVRLGRARSKGHTVSYECSLCGDKSHSWIGY